MLRKKDKLLLKELIKDSRQKIVRLAERCHMSRQSVYGKINELRSKGISFTIDVNPETVGLNLRAYILIVAEPQAKFRNEADKKLKKIKGISQVHYVLGRFDIIAEVIVKDRFELRRVLKEIQNLPAVKKTETFIVHETTKYDLKEPLIKALSK
jgi:DNA-binding Lrp family transcriptional regulator